MKVAGCLFQTDDLLAFKDRSPSANVHLLIIPKHHIGTVRNLTQDDIPLLEKMLILGKQLLREQGYDVENMSQISGAFSQVYKAIDKKTGQRVAIKVVRKYEMNLLKRTSVQKEAEILRSLDHPCITKLLAFEETKDYFFLVIELLNGGGEIFQEIVRLTYFSENLARHCIQQVAEAIRYLHEERGVVHRDIKPENILFEFIPSSIFHTRASVPSAAVEAYNKTDGEYANKRDEALCSLGIGCGSIGKVKLADFGLSKVIWNEQTMTPCGTVGYTAPEILLESCYSKSVDMWALGCVLYSMLCGFPPFYDESVPVLTQKVASGRYTFMSPWWDDVSLEAKDLISHLLETNSKKRYTISQVLRHPWMNKQPTTIDSSSNNLDTIISRASKGNAELQQLEKNILQAGRYSVKSRSADSVHSIPSFPVTTSTPTLAEDTMTTSTNTTAANYIVNPPPMVPLVHSLPRDIPGTTFRKMDDYHYNFLPSSPVAMKESFSISYNVRRMEEERVQQVINRNGLRNFAVDNLRAFQTSSSFLSVNEKNEDDSSYSVCSMQHDENLRQKSGASDQLPQQTQAYLHDDMSTEEIVLSNGFLQMGLTANPNKTHKHIVLKSLTAEKNQAANAMNRTMKATFDLNLKDSTLFDRRKKSSSII
ncbi:kinase-like domain-containing protein [Mycotypha africana]|uniref:kinase-like domain-containing protein n=1 Tax=Mycotypha africana TaxID=64632 RepID=UPI002300BD83|nr:kinase-like domain-containing protein [Mycotypha africana]KAI8987697.1 kinase-like domain-containing protein [Mycotypha africana]